MFELENIKINKGENKRIIKDKNTNIQLDVTIINI